MLLAVIGAIAVLASTFDTSTGQPADPSPRIFLRRGSFDPLTDSTDDRQTIASNTSLHLVQFQRPVDATTRRAIEAAGATILDYLPDNAFLIQPGPSGIGPVRSLPGIRWTGALRGRDRLAPELDRLAASEFATVVVDLAPGATIAGGTPVPTGLGNRAIITLPGQAITGLSQLDGVRYIAPKATMRLLNEPARGILGVAPAWSSGLFGAGQIVAVADTGLDTGNVSTLHADFGDRIAAAIPLAAGRPTDWSDPNGHGTHVAGSVAGTGLRSGSDPAANAYAGSNAGVAPAAKLIIQAIGEANGDLSGIPIFIGELFNDPYNRGARIHSNSWGGPTGGFGTPTYGAYDFDAQGVDEFVWTHPDFLPFFAAGNDGTDRRPADGVVDVVPNTINTPGTAKNIVTVGASENLRLSGGYNPGSGRCSTFGGCYPTDYLFDPIRSDRLSDNPNGLAAFSSRGPTSDGRIKPDLLAPGTNILSTRSTKPGAGTLWGAADGWYAYSGGTSMSTPLAAGSAALIREWLMTARGLPSPSGALVKAVLIHGAVDTAPGQYGSGPTREIPAQWPNGVEGFGRLNVQNSVLPPGAVTIDLQDIRPGLSTGEAITFTVVAPRGGPLAATLVWADYPGSPAAGKALVNDLDLSIVGPNGTVRWGNGGLTADRLNTVEAIRFTAQPGSYQIVVRAETTPFGPQPFALVISQPVLLPDITPPAGSLTVTDLTVTPQVTLNLTAADSESGWRWMAIQEASIVDGSWRVVGQTDWLPAVQSLDWTLSNGNGAKVIAAYFADAAGNVSVPAFRTVNLNVPAVQLVSGAVIQHRFTLSPAIGMTATLTVSGGDADLALWRPGSTGSPDAVSDRTGMTDRIAIGATVPGLYILEVIGRAGPVSTTLTIDRASPAGSEAFHDPAKPLPAAPSVTGDPLFVTPSRPIYRLALPVSGRGG